jgi:hypothetical protein
MVDEPRTDPEMAERVVEQAAAGRAMWTARSTH